MRFKFSHVPFVRDRRPRFRLLGRQFSTASNATGDSGAVDGGRVGLLPPRVRRRHPVAGGWT